MEGTKHEGSMSRKSISLLIVLFVIPVLLSCSAVSQNQRDATQPNVPQPLTILHYNDYHSANLSYTRVIRGDTLTMGGAANLAAYINHFKSTEPNPVLFHTGDDFQGSPVSMLTRGRSQVDIMNAMGLDAFAVGNHEYDYGADTLLERLSHAEFPALSANVIDSVTGELLWAPDTVLTIGSVRVGVIGVVLEGLREVTTAKATAGLATLPAVETIQKSLQRLTPISDVQILLSHSGHYTDSVLAEQIGPDLELIIGGHSHWRIWEPWYVNGVPIVQAGSRGEFLGVTEMMVDTSANTAKITGYELVRTLAGVYEPDSAMAAVVDKYEGEVAHELDQQIATIKSDWIRRDGESNLGNWITDAFRSFARADVAVMNNHGIRKNLMAGPVTVRDILEINPFGNELMKLTVSGDQLQIVANHLAARGPIVNVSGMRVKVRDGRLLEFTVNGKKPEPEKHYSLVGPSYLVDHMDNYLGLDPKAVDVEATGYLDRDALLPAAQEQGEIDSKIEGRLDFGD
jgi:2',3'-cyclic-nucleotide 2'-phosphodiesterase (5'-nucleotidase family)